MVKRIIHVLILVALVLAGRWAWLEFFPSPERVIRQELYDIARLASYSSNEGPAAKLLNAGKLAGFFTPYAVIRLNVPGDVQSLTGREDIARTAFVVRQRAASMRVEIADMIVTVAPDRSSAIVNLTGRANAPGESDFFVQELRLNVIRDGRQWLISKVETVKTLR